MTIREIISRIVNLTQEINKRRAEYQEEADLEGMETNFEYERRFSELESRSFSSIKDDKLVANPRGSVYDRKLGRKRRKRKQELEQQLSDLESFVDLDVYTPEGREAFEERGYKSYETFKQHFKLDEDFSEGDWAQFIEQFNMIKTEATQYGYEDRGASKAYVQAYTKASDKQRAKFGETVAKAYKNVKKKKVQGVTYKDILRETKKLMKQI